MMKKKNYSGLATIFGEFPPLSNGTSTYVYTGFYQTFKPQIEKNKVFVHAKKVEKRSAGRSLSRFRIKCPRGNRIRFEHFVN